MSAFQGTAFQSTAFQVSTPTGTTVSPGLRTLTLTTFAPTVTVASSARQPIAATLTLNMYAPTVTVSGAAFTVTPDIRIDWRGDGFSAITNEAFLTDTTGWSVGAGINAAATSITRGTGDGVLGGMANSYATLVTTATSGSGTTYDLGTTSFVSGRTYRFTVWCKSVSGTTSARILIGSLGTVGDRASWTGTITTAWVKRTVDWTPSGTRTDVEAIVTNNAASVMTARICLAEVYEAIDDIGPAGYGEAFALEWTRGANFDGTAESPGTCTISVTNIAQRYSPDNTASVLSGLLTTGRPVLVRAVDTTPLVYGAFHGTLRRLVPRPETRTAELMFQDRLYDLDRRDVSLAASTTRSIADFRGAVLDDAGYSAAQRSLALGSPEIHIPTTGADQRKALGVLAECNLATGSIHYADPHPVPSVAWRYTTVDRTMLQTAAAVDTIVDTTSPGVTMLGSYDVTDEALVTSQRVYITTRTLAATATVWESGDLPFVVAAGSTVDIWANFTDPVFSQAVVYEATNAPTVNLTPFSRSAKITITAGGTAAIVSALSVTGRAQMANSEGSHQSTTDTGIYRGTDISTDLVDTRTVATGLADWVILRYGTAKARPDLTLTNDTGSLTTDIGDTVALTFGLLTITAQRYIVRSLATRVETNALEWITTYGLEAGLPDTVLFTVGGTAAEGIGGSGVLAT